MTSRRKEESYIVRNNKEDFEITYISKPDRDTLVITSQEEAEKWLESATYRFGNNYNQYSSYLNESSIGKSTITSEELDVLAENAQSSLDKTNRINSIIKYYINKDDLIGKVYETIESNVNTDYRLSFPDIANDKGEVLSNQVKKLINKFNKDINLAQLLRKAIPIAYSEGNYPMYLRKKGDNYFVDYYPLGVVEVSDYELSGEPYLIVNINELRSRLNKTNKKNKKGKSLFFKSLEDELKNNYPEEIYNGFLNKDNYVKLNIENTGMVRVNNLNRKYGLSPIFRALKASLMLDTFDRADRINAKAKAKKIIFQKLHKELLGQEYDKNTFQEMAYAHESFMNAWKNETVMYTGAAFVEDIKYVEPKTESTNINNVNYYRNKQMTSLGIGFLNQDSKQSFTVANISITELMKIINKIAEQIEDILEKWYQLVLEQNNISIEYAPTIELMDSEELDKELKLKLAELLHSKFNASYETAFGLLGVDVEDEKKKRQKENDEGYDEIFAPRITAYTNSGYTAPGRPVDNNNPDKQMEDQDRRKSE